MLKNKQQLSNIKVEISNKEFDKMKRQALLIDVREYQILKKIANINNELNIINVPYYDLIKNPSTYINDKIWPLSLFAMQEIVQQQQLLVYVSKVMLKLMY